MNFEIIFQKHKILDRLTISLGKPPLRLVTWSAVINDKFIFEKSFE